MKIRTIGPLLLVLFLVAAGHSQANSCAYTFTYPKAQVPFSFCVTAYGTLASIQSPIGVNHLDPVNPIEGWTGDITDNDGGHDGWSEVPGMGIGIGSGPLPLVSQPHGAGTLPLIFDFGEGFLERVDAVPYQRQIILTLTVRSCRGSVRDGTDCYWSGSISRIANITTDGNSTGNFAHSAFAAFGYVTHGVMLSVDEGAGCAGTDPNGASATPYDTCPVSAPFVSSGGVFTSWGFHSYNGHPMSMRATYRVF